MDFHLCDLVTDIPAGMGQGGEITTFKKGVPAMSINVGSADRVIRILLGLVLIALPFVMAWGTLGTVVSVLIGAVLVITALVRFCPAYRLLGIRTCKV